MTGRLVIPVPWLVLLAACGGEGEPVVQPESDPAMLAALNAPLMTDPDLVALNRANTAALLPDQDGSIPAEDASSAAVASARADALALVGGAGRMKQAPDAHAVLGELPPGATLTAGARAAASPGVSGQCARAVSYTAAWAAKMPEAFPVFPRAAVHEAAGTDAGRCRLRAVNFTTPVPLDEVIDFYFTRAESAGYATEHVVRGGESTLRATKGPSSVMIYGSRRGDGMISVDLVTDGA